VKTTPTKTTPAKITTTKITPTKITPAKGKGKAIEYETNIKLDYTIETIILTAEELGIYYEEAYHVRRYTLIIVNNLLINLY
jgi:hypothetical protein